MLNRKFESKVWWETLNTGVVSIQVVFKATRPMRSPKEGVSVERRGPRTKPWGTPLWRNWGDGEKPVPGMDEEQPVSYEGSQETILSQETGRNPEKEQILVKCCC